MCILSSKPQNVSTVFGTTQCVHCLQNHTVCSLSSGPYSVFIIFWRAPAMRPSTSSYSAFLVFSQAICCNSIVFMTTTSVLSSGKLRRHDGLLSGSVLVSKSNCNLHQYQSSGNCVKKEENVLGSRSLLVRTVSVPDENNIAPHHTHTHTHTHTHARTHARTHAHTQLKHNRH